MSIHFEIRNGVLVKYHGRGTHVLIPNSVTKIGDMAFLSCTSLTSVVIPNGVTEIEWAAFKGCTKLSSVVIPDSVTEIGWEAFSGCISLSSVDIPNSIKIIGKEAFLGCTNLSSVNIPNSVKIIGDMAFLGCTNLSSVDIPNSVKIIGDKAFNSCAALADENGFVIIRDVLHSFHGDSSSTVIPNSVKIIGEHAFWCCTALTSVIIPDSVTKIGGHAFWHCKSLSSIVIPDSVTEIGGSAFEGCTSLSSVVIPDSVTKIGDSTFKECTGLTLVVIPDSVKDIHRGAFNILNRNINVTVVCGEGSCAHQFCMEHGIAFLFDFLYEAFHGLIPAGAETLSSPFLADEEQPYIFISYSHRDRERVLPILKTLYEAGWRIWYDEGLTIGDSYDETLENHVENCSAFLLFVTENSLNSLYIEKNEVPWALRFEKPIVKCILDDGKDYEITEDSVIATVSPSEIEPALARISRLKKGDPRTAKGITVAVDPANRSQAAGGGFAYCLYAEENASAAKAILFEAKNGGCSLYDAVESREDEEKFQSAACLIVFLDKAFLSDQALTKLLIEAHRAGKDITVCRLEDVGAADYPPELNELDKMHALNFVHGITPDMNKKLTRHLQKRGCRNAAALPGFEYEKTDEGIVIKKYTGTDPEPKLEREYGGIPVVEIAEGAFESCTRLKTFIIPDKVRYIGTNAFKGCTNLSSIVIPKSINKIKDETFANCTGLTSVVIPDSVIQIGDGAFAFCTSLTSVVIPDSVTEIESNAFKGCTSLASVVIPNSVIQIGDSTFADCTSLSSVVIPDSVTEIGSEAFLGCTSLTSVIIPDSVTEIGGGVFWRCTSLTSVVIPNSNTEVGFDAFYKCKSITVFCPRFSCAWKFCKEWKIPVRSIKHAKKQ